MDFLRVKYSWYWLRNITMSSYLPWNNVWQVLSRYFNTWVGHCLYYIFMVRFTRHFISFIFCMDLTIALKFLWNAFYLSQSRRFKQSFTYCILLIYKLNIIFATVAFMIYVARCLVINFLHCLRMKCLRGLDYVKRHPPFEILFLRRIR